MIRFKTETGSTYEVDNDNLMMRRLTPTHELRRDGEWIKLLEPLPMPVLGREAVFALEPLGDPKITDVTFRRTSYVTVILHVGETDLVIEADRLAHDTTPYIITQGPITPKETHRGV